MENDAMLIKSGRRSITEGETWTNWWSFEPPISNETAQEFIREHDICRKHGRPGQMFLNDPVVLQRHTYTIIEQYGGYDV
jgi:hypothetical protein